MHIYILTHNPFKEKELSKYFYSIGLTSKQITSQQFQELPLDEDYICIQEQTKLLSEDNSVCTLDKFEKVTHHSELTLFSRINNVSKTLIYKNSLDGFIFPHLKTNREDVYNWDDIFVSASTMKSYQEMKDLSIKNSARDINFSHMMDDLPSLFKFDNINLNFNPIEANQVISFEPIIDNLFHNNQYYKIAYQNEVFKPIINYLISDGLFIRSATNRKQKNYWLPGLNAGIPLTPKRDELHELTFMFHDIMHFLFPDLTITNNEKSDKHKYIIYRMISEAFTLVLADILFISLLNDNHVEYDYSKRKIFPLFENIKFDISKQNLPKIKQLLWANTCFALLGDDKLQNLVQNDSAFSIYKGKYQPIFQADYIWTNHNYHNISKNYSKNKLWMNMFNDISPDIIIGTHAFCPSFDINSPIQNQVESIFDVMFSKLESIVLNNYTFDKSQNRAAQRYMAGQLFIFYKYDTIYNHLFLTQIKDSLSKNSDITQLKSIYNIYIDLLVKDNFITKYEAENYKNIYPFFDPFYVFYEREQKESYKDTLNRIFQ